MRGFDHDLRQFCLYTRNTHIEYIKEEDITFYFNSMLSLGWKSSGIMPKSIALRNLFKYATKSGLRVMSHELIPIPKREYFIPRVAKDEEIVNLLELSKGKTLQPVRNRCIINFLRSTGCRNGEMCAINLSQLMEHFNEKRVVIRTAKTRGMKPIRELFWDEPTHKALTEWLDIRNVLSDRITFTDPDALFVGVRNWQTGKRLTNHAVSIIFRKLSKKAGIPTMNPHSLRHYRGHELNNFGANNSTISGVLGHSSLASSFVYTQMKSDELQTAAKKYRKVA